MTDTLLSTGQAARLLGVSRQHVVDLCESGRLDFVRVGTHRRIPGREVERFSVRAPSLTREQERSLWLHRAVVAELVAQPDAVLDVARANLARWASQHRADSRTGRAFAAWMAVIDAGVDAVIATLLDASDEACEMRQNSPFAGVLPDQRRQDVLRSFGEHWRNDHTAATA